MKKVGVFIAILIVLAGIFLYLKKDSKVTDTLSSLPTQLSQKLNSSSYPTATDIEQIKVIATGLDTPWALAFLPTGEILVTERQGTVRLIDKNGNLKKDPIATISSAKEIGEGGLLGIALHPNFVENNFVYLYYTYRQSGDNTFNRVARMTYKNETLSDEKIMVDEIPGASNHNGGRIKFGPDKLLYITTGDAQEPSRAQDKNSKAGKILRVTDEGSSSPGNPFGNLTYSYGHRNIQGITWDQNGILFATEHGRSGALSGLDEINRIESGKNYGWPDIQGTETKGGMVTPIRNSGSTTWAPAGVAFVNNSLFFGGLRGQTLYQALLNGNQVGEVKDYFKTEFGRIREVIVGPDNMLYITTSNKDGRGTPKADDDKVIRINPSKL